MPDSALDHALRYAKMGLAVFPCHGKRPITPNGWKDASLSEKVIAAWFKGRDDLNLAVVIPDWAVVLDVDGPDGAKNLLDHGFTPPGTATASTPRGRHHWYLWKGDVSPTRKISFLPKVDILTNGYVLVPPSPGYSWEEGSYPSQDTLEFAPEWMVVARQEASAYKERIDVGEFFGGLAEGSRQSGLFRYACRLRSDPRMTETEASILVAELARRSEGNGYKKYPDTNALVKRVWKTYDAAEGSSDVPSKPEIMSLAELVAVGHPPPEYLIEDMLPVFGYVVLSSRPKAGKSLVAAEVAVAVACGVDLWGKRTKQAGVLYIDAEQDEASAVDRWKKILSGMAIAEFPNNLHVSFSWRPMDEGGMEDIGDVMVSKPSVRLVIVDTLADMYPKEDDGGGNAYHREQRVMRRFLKLSKDYGVSVMVITHDSKAKGQTMLHRASSTFAVTGKAHGVWNLERNDLNDSAKLLISGKNIPDQEIKLTLDRDFLLWRVGFA